jgi:uncharacterized protein
VSTHHDDPSERPDVSDLLERHESVRDPVHKDIWITALERRIIDTRAFQRLRHIAQLGPASLVYPGAIHNRFLHSLGTLHVTDELIEIINRNARNYGSPHFIEVNGYPRLLARLVALLHDLAHIPFGHTLEDEGNLYPPEWEDKERVSRWLGEDGEIGKTISGFLVMRGFKETFAAELMQNIRQYLTAQRQEVEQLEFPYVTDIVGNTLCADLLDYHERDAYFCGLQERIGDRFLNYIAVLRLENTSATRPERPEYRVSTGVLAKSRVVLLAYRLERDHNVPGEVRPVPKWDVLSEATDLLRSRFSLAEKVYFHRTKLVAGSMLISAAAESSMPLQELYEATEDKFLGRLQADENPRTAALAKAYVERRLYRPLFRLNYRPETEMDDDSNRLWHEVYDRFRDPNERSKCERELEREVDLPPGSVSIYCPDREMTLKRFEMLVQTRPDGEIKLFSSILDEPRQAEMKALNKRFQQLWSLQVFVDPAHIDPSQVNNTRVMALNGLCEHVDLFGLQNDNRLLRGRRLSNEDRLVREVVGEWDRAHPDERVPAIISWELEATRHRGGATKKTLWRKLEAEMTAHREQRVRTSE